MNPSLLSQGPALARLAPSSALHLTYAIAPPSQRASPEKRRAIAETQSARIAELPIDALLVYDVQDETLRNLSPRPFPFSPKVDALSYAYEELEVRVPRVVYRAVQGQDETSLVAWMRRVSSLGGRAVFVGAPSRNLEARLTLPDAWRLRRSHVPHLPLGGVVIAERHHGLGTEEARVLAKREQGCEFFVSQTVWSTGAMEALFRDLLRAHRAETAPGLAFSELPHILVTLSPCGSIQTLDFLEWLGVFVPPNVRSELLSARDMLTRSVELALEIYGKLRALAAGLGLSIGWNIESVSTRKEEVEAAVELLRRIAQREVRAGRGRRAQEVSLA